MTRPLIPAEVRFWPKVLKADGCWEWQGFRTARGYGIIASGRKGRQSHERAHRVSWRIHFGAVPAGLNVLHRCDNPPCVRPEHLFLGTQADNMADKTRKGRGSGGSMPGERNPMSKLTEADVLTARQLHADGASLHSIARTFHVDRKTITQAIRGERWRHVA